MAKEQFFYATGRRKTSAARVYIKNGTGQININGKKIADYLKRKSSQMIMKQPLMLTQTDKKYDLKIYVKGGGESGQAGAIRHGISRALLVVDDTLRGVLKKAGYLTRDSRAVERKKYGLKGARARYQYSKR